MNLPARPLPKVPANLRPYVETLGPELAAEVFLTLGGSEVALTESTRGGSQLATIVGQEKASALAAHPGMPAVRARIPLANRWVVLFLHWQGHSGGEIARRTRVSSTTVRKYLKERAG